MAHIVPRVIFLGNHRETCTMEGHATSLVHTGPIHAFAGGDRPDADKAAHTALCGTSIPSELLEPVFEVLTQDYWAFNQVANVERLIDCPACQLELAAKWNQLRTGRYRAPMPAAPVEVAQQEAPAEPAPAADAGPALHCAYCGAEYYVRPGHRAQIKAYCSEKCSAIARVRKRHAKRKLALHAA